MREITPSCNCIDKIRRKRKITKIHNQFGDSKRKNGRQYKNQEMKDQIF